MANIYTAEVKAAVVAGWQSGASLGSLVKAHDVPKSTIREWIKGHERTTVAPKNIEYDGPSLDEMAWSLVGGAFGALDAIQSLAKDGLWLKQQNAADLAVFYGVVSDKLIRLLGATRTREDDVPGAAIEAGA